VGENLTIRINSAGIVDIFVDVLGIAKKYGYSGDR
jgi:hypothetical protein